VYEPSTPPSPIPIGEIDVRVQEGETSIVSAIEMES
jgi:hypothetical protein